MVMSEAPIYTELKKKILFLEYSPGSVLREKEIMERFGVSRPPAREALMRLEIDGLVRIIPHVGTFVADISFQQLKNVFEVNSHLVGLVGQLAAARITRAELDDVRRQIDAMKKTRDSQVLMQLDQEIHRIINRATKNEVLSKTLNALHDQSVRIWAFSGNDNEYWNDLATEHENIAAALERRDGELAAELLKRHSKRFVEDIRSQLAV